MNAADDQLLSATAQVPEHVVYRAFEQETLLLNLDTGQYHGLNATGGRLIELLGPAGGVLREAIGLLAQEYDVAFDEIAPDLVAFCHALEERGLIAIERGA
jgi:hypothetical protein